MRKKSPGCCAVNVTVPVARSVATVAPVTAGTGAASVSLAFGLVGSTPGRLLASGCRVTGAPTTASAASGSATGATNRVDYEPSTETLSDAIVGVATRPSLTP